MVYKVHVFCIKCKKECKQSSKVIINQCNFDPINPGKKRGRKRKGEEDGNETGTESTDE